MADPPVQTDIDKKQPLTSEATLDLWLPDDVSDEQFSETPFITNTGTSLPLDLELRLSCRPLIDLSSTGSNSFCETVITDFVVGKERGSTVKDLGPLLHLNGTLRISKLQNVVSPKDAANARLVEKTQLDELVLEWGDDNVDPEHDRDVLEQLVPHTNLKKLSISFYCGTKFPHWLGDYSFSNMFFLRLSQCKNCLDLPPLGALPSLKFLIIEWMDAGMLEWEEWDLFDIGKGEFPCLRELCIRRCPKLIQNLPISLPSIVKVEISESPKLVTTVIAAASSYKGLLHYHDKIRFISDDKVASFSEPEKVDFFFTTKDDESSSLPTIEGMMQSATELSLQGIANSSFPMTVGGVGSSFPMTEDVAAEFSLHMTQTPNIRNEADVPTNNWSNQDARQDLSSFKARSCDSLETLPLDIFPMLRSLSIWDCPNLESLTMPKGIPKNLTSLEALEIRDCPKLVSFPKGGLPTPNLTSIWFSNCKNLKELPDQLHNLNCLREWGLHKLDCLRRLEIEGGCKNVESFPEDKLLPCILNSLRISGLSNLKYLNSKGLQHLTDLKTLEISCCNKLQSLPEEGLPSSLSFLCIKECSLLKPTLQNKRRRLV
uniref:R13L1/DRL21-like LRR repeat region domain-containing protein n=1 Tax=Fagus sylvatica TaxID=28930 RepID=A0A2N9GIS6_FAGSY